MREGGRRQGGGVCLEERLEAMLRWDKNKIKHRVERKMRKEEDRGEK